MNLLFLIVLLALIDTPYLWHVGPHYNRFLNVVMNGRIRGIQIWPALIIYPLMACGINRFAKSADDAFILGLMVYGVFDFTLMLMFKDYPLSLALTDTLWGGLLFSLTYLMIQNVIKK